MRKALITLCVIFISAAVNAETINLLSGKPIEGEVVYVAEDYIKIDTGDGVLKIFYDQMGWKQAEGFQAIWEERAGADGEVEPESVGEKKASPDFLGIYKEALKIFDKNPVRAVELATQAQLCVSYDITRVEEDNVKQAWDVLKGKF